MSDPVAPLAVYGSIGAEASLVIAFAIGCAFGFFLERAGFGSARKLTAVFYFFDMAVLKVMFTAIVTAMTGLWVLGATGWLDVSAIFLVPTYIVPQLVGGLLLGVGFVVGGYCPGTSLAGVATGRIDAMVYAGGMLAGQALYAEIYPAIEPFTQMTSLGEITLPQLTGLPAGALVVLVLIMAAGAFVFAAWLERRFASRRPARA